MKEFSDLASKLIDKAKRSIDGLEVCISQTKRGSIKLEKQDIHLASFDDVIEVGLRVTEGEQIGFAACNSLEIDELEETLEKAKKIAKLSPKNPFCQLNSLHQIPLFKISEKSFEAWNDTSMESIQKYTRLLWDTSKEFPFFKLNEGKLEVSTNQSYFANSLGIERFEKTGGFVWSLMGMAIEKENITSFDYFSNLSRSKSGLEDRIVHSTKEFCGELDKNLKVGKAHSYRGKVLFMPKAVSEMFLPAFTFHLNGRNVADSISKWQTKLLGEKVLSSEITLWDHPWNQERFGFSGFDREGFLTTPTLLVYQGNLTQFLLDSYAAFQLSMQSNGHAVASASQTPSVGTWSLCLASGEHSLSELIHQKGPLLVVHRFSGNVDPVTGDFSGVAKGSHWYLEGGFEYSVKEVLISGNFFNVLGSDLLGLSSQTQVVDSQEECPAVLCDGITVTAKESS